MRREGDLPTDDVAADEPYDRFGATCALFEQVYGRDSVDGSGGPLDAAVHYGVGYDNAFGDGRRMVFGDALRARAARAVAGVGGPGGEPGGGIGA